MRLKTFHTLCLLSIVSLFASFQRIPVLYWREDRKLTIEDFRMTPPKSNHAAVSNCKFDYAVSTKKDSIFFDITAEFDPKKSWMKKEFRSLEALNHEQRHFDIVEIHARMMRRNILSLGRMKEVRIRKKVDKVFVHLTESLTSMQKCYDMEAGRLSDTIPQKKWDNKIDSLLISLEAYKKREVSLKIK